MMASTSGLIPCENSCSSMSGQSTSCDPPDWEAESHSLQSTPTNSAGADEGSVFYFESDHVALKGNRDYHSLLRTVALLEAQRIQAIQDLDRLIDAQKEALADPIGFVEKLQRKVDIGLPKAHKIPELPNIQWEKYTSNVDPLNMGKHKHMTRLKRTPQANSSTPQEEDGESNSSQSKLEVVRGRLRDSSKPQTFNTLWTAEEQHQLEELLISFPPEEVEARRWEKIATALGNRTTQQVASRVQKYFIKLAKAGLPIPGRMPNLATYGKKASLHRHQRYNKFYFQPSTFMTSYEPPVYMSDDDDHTSYTGSSNDFDLLQQHMTNDQDLSDDDIPVELKDSDEYQELKRLKRLRQQKVREEGQHVGYKCDNCSCEPIVGTRWHCVDCLPESSVDFCDQCCDSMFETATHSCSHQLEPVRVNHSDQPHIDNDYTKFTTGDYNYLDPNYIPA